ncbi:5548_t:CDS:2 [Ambispora leptoticha]|uniref:5548_t:CDS:1 n=1 Tax=Ambispora leptoticha TaxID=144679 RepID=A0A9N9G3G1_9GLOM|nr:5548_t:CDS:2 [Ambispora leptoticha]
MIDSSNSTNSNETGITSIEFIHESEDYENRERMRASLRNIPAEMVPPVDVPFPPDVNPKDLIRRDQNGILRARATNKFLIYRSQYAKALKAKGFCISMRTVSTLASKSWQKEPRKVQRKYEELAKEVAKLREEMSTDPTNCEKKKKNDNTLHNNNIINTENSLNMAGLNNFGNNHAGFSFDNFQSQQYFNRYTNFQFPDGYFADVLIPDETFIQSSQIVPPQPIVPSYKAIGDHLFDVLEQQCDLLYSM